MLRILALGDSYTIGEGVSPGKRWTALLAERLRERGLAVQDPLVIARTGWTTDELAGAVQAAVATTGLSGPFDLVSLLIGVNNQYRGRSVEEYRVQFRELLSQAVAFTGGRAGRVLVLSIPDWSVTPFAGQDERWKPLRAQIAAQIDAFNDINRAESQGAGARYIDITPITRQKGSDPGWVAADGLHPSGEMYAAWVKLALPDVLDAVRD